MIEAEQLGDEVSGNFAISSALACGPQCPTQAVEVAYPSEARAFWQATRRAKYRASAHGGESA